MDGPRTLDDVLGTVKNLGRVLDLYSSDRAELGVTEIADELGMSKSKAHLLVSSMAEIGVLRRVHGGRYRIGWRALQLDRVAAETTPFRLPGRSAAVMLARRTGQTIHLAALDGGRVVYVDRMQGERATQLALSAIGKRLPAHCSGVGKVLLAHLDPEEVETQLERHGMERFTPATITDPRTLRGELDEIRRQGLGFDREEVVTGLSCVAAPIHDADGEVVAALSISAPVEVSRANEDAYRRLVLGATARIDKLIRSRGTAT
jgi:IclR family KDG regulon transcriptional repressor